MMADEPVTTKIINRILAATSAATCFFSLIFIIACTKHLKSNFRGFVVLTFYFCNIMLGLTCFIISFSGLMPSMEKNNIICLFQTFGLIFSLSLVYILIFLFCFKQCLIIGWLNMFNSRRLKELSDRNRNVIITGTIFFSFVYSLGVVLFPVRKDSVDSCSVRSLYGEEYKSFLLLAFCPTTIFMIILVIILFMTCVRLTQIVFLAISNPEPYATRRKAITIPIQRGNYDQPIDIKDCRAGKRREITCNSTSSTRKSLSTVHEMSDELCIDVHENYETRELSNETKRKTDNTVMIDDVGNRTTAWFRMKSRSCSHTNNEKIADIDVMDHLGETTQRAEYGRYKNEQTSLENELKSPIDYKERDEDTFVGNDGINNNRSNGNLMIGDNGNKHQYQDLTVYHPNAVEVQADVHRRHIQTMNLSNTKLVKRKIIGQHNDDSSNKDVSVPSYLGISSKSKDSCCKSGDKETSKVSKKQGDSKQTKIPFKKLNLFRQHSMQTITSIPPTDELPADERMSERSTGKMREIKALKNMIMLLLTVLIFTGPFVIAQWIDLFDEHLLFPQIRFVSFILLIAYSILNLSIYIFSVPEIIHAFVESL